MWEKSNPMPESVLDRPTRSHEYVFLLTKSERYYYDAEAIREPIMQASWDRAQYKPSAYAEKMPNLHGRRPANGVDMNPAGRNKRSVWTISTQSFSGAHFATMPEALVLPCLLAGSSAHGACAHCGAPWARVVEKVDHGFADRTFRSPHRTDTPGMTNGSGKTTLAHQLETTTLGWKPTCACDCNSVEPCTVLDPFAGACTTGVVAVKQRRHFIGIDNNRGYLLMGQRRIEEADALFTRVLLRELSV